MPTPRLSRRAPAVARGPVAGVVATAAATLAAATLLTPVRRAAAQVVGLPVAQTPFPGRPLAIAVNAGGGGDGIQALGAAVALRRGGNSRLTATLGAAAVRGFATTRPAFGARVAYLQPFGADGAIAVAPFAGIGVLTRGDEDSQTESDNDRPILIGSVTVAPAGVGFGYRRLVGGRPVAVHATPQVQYWRRGPGSAAGSEASSRFYVRGGLGADVGLTRQIGLSLAYELGAASNVTGSGQAATGLGEGPRSGVFGIALSYAPGRGGAQR